MNEARIQTIDSQSSQAEFIVSGMGCAGIVSTSLKRLQGVQAVQTNISAHKVAVLKQANVGIAIGAGADVAIEAADVTLVRGELTKVVEAVRLSRATFRKILQNLFWAWFYNVAAIPIAAIGLLHPMIGVIAMTTSSLSVIGNSLLLKRARLTVEGAAEKAEKLP